MPREMFNFRKMNSLALDSLKHLRPAILHKPMPSWAALNAAGNQTKTGSQVVSLHHVASHRAETAVHKTALSQSWGKMLK